MAYFIKDNRQGFRVGFFLFTFLFVSKDEAWLAIV